MPRSLPFPRPQIGRLGYPIKVGDDLVFLIREDFNTDYAAPLVQPINADPGPGVWSLIQDATAKFSISSGVLRFTDIQNNTWMMMSSLPIARQNGIALFAKYNQNSLPNLNFRFGFGHDTTLTLPPLVNCLVFNTSASDGLLAGSQGAVLHASTNWVDVDIDRSVEHDFTIILRNPGAYYICDDRLVAIDERSSITPLYVSAGFGATATSAPVKTLDELRVIDLTILDSLFSSRWFLATYYSATPSAGTTFTHDADGFVDFIASVLPTTDNMDVYFRCQSLSPLNGWCLRLTTLGNAQLYEVVNDVFTQRVSVGGPVPTGTRVLADFRDQRIFIYRSNAGGLVVNQLQNFGSYLTAVGFQTETIGHVAGMGSGTMSDLAAHPHDLPSNIVSTLTTIRNT